MAKKLRPSTVTLEGILLTLGEQLAQLKETHRVKSLAIFGSYARRQSTSRSDLDLLVVFDRAPTMFEFVRLERHLTTILGVKVDLVMKTALKPEIGRHILAELVPV